MLRGVNRYRLGANMNKFGRSVLTILDSMSQDNLTEEGVMLSTELRTLANTMSTTTKLAHDYHLVKDIEDLLALVLRHYDSPVLYDEDDEPIISEVEVQLEECSHLLTNIRLELNRFDTRGRGLGETPVELLVDAG